MVASTDIDMAERTTFQRGAFRRKNRRGGAFINTDSIVSAAHVILAYRRASFAHGWLRCATVAASKNEQINLLTAGKTTAAADARVWLLRRRWRHIRHRL